MCGIDHTGCPHHVVSQTFPPHRGWRRQCHRRAHVRTTFPISGSERQRRLQPTGRIVRVCTGGSLPPRSGTGTISVPTIATSRATPTVRIPDRAYPPRPATESLTLPRLPTTVCPTPKDRVKPIPLHLRVTTRTRLSARAINCSAASAKVSQMLSNGLSRARGGPTATSSARMPAAPSSSACATARARSTPSCTAAKKSSGRAHPWGTTPEPKAPRPWF